MHGPFTELTGGMLAQCLAPGKQKRILKVGFLSRKHRLLASANAKADDTEIAEIVEAPKLR